MKKKGIVISIIGIVITSIALLILVNKNTPKTFMQDGVLFAVTINGSPSDKFPDYTKGKYTVDVDCKNGDGKWIQMENDETGVYEWNLFVDDITGSVSCNLAFADKSDNDTLISKIQETETKTKINNGICSDEAYTTKSSCENAGKYWWGVVDESFDVIDYTTAVSLTESEYGSTDAGTLSIFSSSSYTSTSGTTDDDAFEPTEEGWASVPANLTSSTFYHFKTAIQEAGYYQLCYTMSSGHSSNYLYLYKNRIQLTIGGSSYSLSASSSSEKSGCVEIGYLNANEYVKVIQRAYSSGNADTDSTRIATVSFYLQKTNQTKKLEVGLRYEGKNPDNYVWFNNELWRIIGYVGAKDANSNNTNLVKIIREESIGGIAFNPDENTVFVDSLIYNMLNSYYYSRTDGTNSGKCYGYKSSIPGNCNYEETGLNEIAQPMVVPVQWAIGPQGSSAYVGTHYQAETGTYTSVTGGIKVGLMSISDYGYGVLNADCGRTSVKLNTYATSSCAGKNWLYGQGYEWTISPHSASNVWHVGNDGDASTNRPYNGYAVRPSLYLDANTYVVMGEGTKDNPYILGL